MYCRSIYFGLLLAITLSACSSLPSATSTAAGGDDAQQPAASSAAKGISPPPVSEKTLMAAVNLENSVFFPSSVTVVDDAGRRLLLGHAERLKSNPDLQVTLVGHTDDLGSPSYNLAIAEQRVNAVYAILRRAGVPLTQIRRYGVGSEQVDRACKSAECRRKMRRVELIYEPQDVLPGRPPG